jgi:hypothetical protein
MRRYILVRTWHQTHLLERVNASMNDETRPPLKAGTQLAPLRTVHADQPTDGDEKHVCQHVTSCALAVAQVFQRTDVFCWQNLSVLRSRTRITWAVKINPQPSTSCADLSSTSFYCALGGLLVRCQRPAPPSPAPYLHWLWQRQLRHGSRQCRF